MFDKCLTILVWFNVVLRRQMTTTNGLVAWEDRLRVAAKTLPQPERENAKAWYVCSPLEADIVRKAHLWRDDEGSFLIYQHGLLHTPGSKKGIHNDAFTHLRYEAFQRYALSYVRLLLWSISPFGTFGRLQKTHEEHEAARRHFGSSETSTKWRAQRITSKPTHSAAFNMPVQSDVHVVRVFRTTLAIYQPQRDADERNVRGVQLKGEWSTRYRWRHQETGVRRQTDSRQHGASRKQVRDLGKPRKNSTFRRPDAQIPVEPQEAQRQPCRRGRDVSAQSYRTISMYVLNVLDSGRGVYV